MYGARMATDEILSYNEDGVLIGDRIASSGWPLPERVDLVKDHASNRRVLIRIVDVDVDLCVPKDHEFDPIILDEDYLVAQPATAGVVEPRRAVLEDFLHLATDPSDAAILDYAGRYGMLGLHLWLGESPAFGNRYHHSPNAGREPLRLWRQIIAEIAAVYTIAGHLRQGRLVERAVWEPLFVACEAPGRPGRPGLVEFALWEQVFVISLMPEASVLMTVAFQERVLELVLGEWLRLGPVHPLFTWARSGSNRPEPVVTLGVTTLFGGLILELLLAVSGKTGFAICSGCATAYIPHRRPPAGAYGAARATYCPTCRAKDEPQRAAERRWRARHPDSFRNRRAREKAQEGS